NGSLRFDPVRIVIHSRAARILGSSLWGGPAGMHERLRGVMPPMCTPFSRSGEIEFSAVREQVEFLISAGVHGIVAGGSGGEGHTLDSAEFEKLMRTVGETINGRVPFVGGVIVNSTAQAIARARRLS